MAGYPHVTAMSATWRDPIDWDRRPGHTKKTFIHNHHEAMDSCHHPSLLQYGQLLAHRVGPFPHRKRDLRFSYSSTLVHHDITPTVPINWVQDIMPRPDDPEWENKIDDRLQWRGEIQGFDTRASGMHRG